MRVDGEHAFENLIQFGRDGEDVHEVIGVIDKISVDAALLCSLVPRIASTCEVYKDDTKGPYIGMRG